MEEKKTPIRYPLTNDYMFHVVLQRSTESCRYFLAAVLGQKPEEITHLQILNPLIPGERLQKKQCILDIRLRINHGEQIGIEMQVSRIDDWPERSLYYLCRSFTSLNRGDYYKTVNPTVHIGILDFNLTADNPYFFSQYRLLNTETFQPYDDKLAMYVIELNKLKNGCNEEHKEIYHWAQLFKAQTWEELDMIEKNHPECGEFVAVLKELNEDEMVQLECEAREIYEWDLHSHHRTGYREGREQGRTEGEFFNIISLTKKKLEKEKTVEVIAEEVETDIALIEQITKIISELPVYTVEGVYEKLKEDKHFH